MGGHESSRPEIIAQSVVEHLLEGCQVLSFEYRYLYLNPAALVQARKSADELLGRTMMECYPGIEQTEMFGALAACMADRRAARMENQFLYPDGTVGWFQLRFIPVPEGLCVLSLDITELKRAEETRRRTEERLGQVQKLEAIGRLAGGVAHDFNNVLSVILSYTDMMLDQLPSADPLRADLAEVRRASGRARELVAQLLACGGQQPREPQSLDVGKVLRELERMLRRMVGPDIELALTTPRTLGRIHADPGCVEQVVMNLVVNARDAVRAGGRITVEVGDAVLDEAYAAQHYGTPPGPYVMLVVSDDGVGMDEATRGRIFEPFFTTKPVGKGTGLGLATVYGIMKQAGGHIGVYSERGVGTTFKVYWPRDDRPLEAPVPASAAPPRALGGNETMLLVEDDRQVRALMLTILRRAGYHVLEAENGGEALLVSEQYAAPIHLLITDLVMPHMNGRTLAARLGAARPDLRALFVSGYTNDAAVQNEVVEAGFPFLQKPITPKALLARVREVLER